MIGIRKQLRQVGSGLVLLCTALALIGRAQAQVVERYKPELPSAPTAPLALPDLAAEEQDATPIGPALSGITLLGADETVGAATTAGIQVGKIARLAPLRRQITRELTPYLG